LLVLLVIFLSKHVASKADQAIIRCNGAAIDQRLVLATIIDE